MKNLTLLFALTVSLFLASLTHGGVAFRKSAVLVSATPSGVSYPSPLFRLSLPSFVASPAFAKAATVQNVAPAVFGAALATTNDLHYIWLNLTGANGLFCQMAFGYRPEATNGVDDFDSTRIDGQFTLNTLIDASASDYVIQSRALPFTMSDVVHLSAKFPVAGTFTITVDQTLGMFSSGQDIILRDKLTGTVHNLAASSYTFSASAGYVTNRFDIAYQSALSVTDVTYQNDVVAFKDASGLVVNAAGQLIKEVSVYDIQGRLLAKKSNIDQNQVAFSLLAENQMLIVSTTLDEGTVITKKIMQ